MVSFFRHLHRTGSYYDPKQWEAEYRIQKKNQRFMRQVKYRRPGSFLDPLHSGPSSPASQLCATASSETRPWGTAHVSSYYYYYLLLLLRCGLMSVVCSAIDDDG